MNIPKNSFFRLPLMTYLGSSRLAVSAGLGFALIAPKAPALEYVGPGPALQGQTVSNVTAKPLTSDEIQKLVPASVYFRGKTAPVQQRNVGGTSFGEDGIFFAAMVDTSGYSTSVQEKYQFYVVTEGPISFGGHRLQPGAYGAGFVNGQFVVMDLGGHTLFQGDTMEDKELKHPRPLQVLGAGNAVKLYLGRRYVLVSSAQPAQ
jgi:hypothetical protein